MIEKNVSTAVDLFRNSHSPRDDFDHFLRCWTQQSCGSCMNSDASCGWCPQVRSSTANISECLSCSFSYNAMPKVSSYQRYDGSQMRFHPTLFITKISLKVLHTVQVRSQQSLKLLGGSPQASQCLTSFITCHDFSLIYHTETRPNLPTDINMRAPTRYTSPTTPPILQALQRQSNLSPRIRAL